MILKWIVSHQRETVPKCIRSNAMKRLMFVLMILALLTTPTLALAGGINDSGGVPLYVIIEVTWDGDPGKDGSWTVHGPLWEPVVDGPVLSSCPMGPPGSCLDMSSYKFTFHGKTVHFDEIYVSGVDATPQIRHVVLHDRDGDGEYTGSLPAEHYTWQGSGTILYMDRIDYTITFDEEGNVEWFYYLQYEHKKME
jgi:hypothetical protein